MVDHNIILVDQNFILADQNDILIDQNDILAVIRINQNDMVWVPAPALRPSSTGLVFTSRNASITFTLGTVTLCALGGSSWASRTVRASGGSTSSLPGLVRGPRRRALGTRFGQQTACARPDVEQAHECRGAAHHGHP